MRRLLVQSDTAEIVALRLLITVQVWWNSVQHYNG